MLDPRPTNDVKNHLFMVLTWLESLSWQTACGQNNSILKEVSMVGNDMMLDPGIGTCGKAGQGVPVGVAQPSILINKMTVGGTKL